MFEDSIPIEAIEPKDPMRQSAIAQAIASKSLSIKLIQITGIPMEVELNKKEIGIVRALIGTRLIKIVGDGSGLDAPNRTMWNGLLKLAQATAFGLAQAKNPASTKPAFAKLKR